MVDRCRCGFYPPDSKRPLDILSSGLFLLLRYYICETIFERKTSIKKKGESMQIPTPQDKFAEFDARLARIEGIVEQMDKRMSSVESRLTNLESRVDSGFRWVIGLLITLLIANVGTAITIILTLNK